MINLIVAVDRNNVIGNADGSLPWKLPPDMKRFKELTSIGVPRARSTVLMGRKTFDSLNRPTGLPNRHNVVLTRGTRSTVEEIFERKEPVFINTLRDYATAHQAMLGVETVPPLWIIGGAEIYRQALELKIVEQLFITLVHISSSGTVKFPYDLYDIEAFKAQQAESGVEWILTDIEEHLDNELPFSFITLKRR